MKKITTKNPAEEPKKKKRVDKLTRILSIFSREMVEKESFYSTKKLGEEYGVTGRTIRRDFEAIRYEDRRIGRILSIYRRLMGGGRLSIMDIEVIYDVSERTARRDLKALSDFFEIYEPKKESPICLKFYDGKYYLWYKKRKTE